MTQASQPRLQRLEAAVVDQRAFLHRIPDPDTRERAEAHLMQLIEMRDAAAVVAAGAAAGDAIV